MNLKNEDTDSDVLNCSKDIMKLSCQVNQMIYLKETKSRKYLMFIQYCQESHLLKFQRKN